MGCACPVGLELGVGSRIGLVPSALAATERTLGDHLPSQQGAAVQPLLRAGRGAPAVQRVRILQPCAHWGPGPAQLLPRGPADAAAAATSPGGPRARPAPPHYNSRHAAGPGAVFPPRSRGSLRLPGPGPQTRRPADPQTRMSRPASLRVRARPLAGGRGRGCAHPAPPVRATLTGNDQDAVLAPRPRGVGTVRSREAPRSDVWVVRPWDRPRGGGEDGPACQSPEGSGRAGNPCGMTGVRGRGVSAPFPATAGAARGPDCPA